VKGFSQEPGHAAAEYPVSGEITPSSRAAAAETSLAVEPGGRAVEGEARVPRSQNLTCARVGNEDGSLPMAHAASRNVVDSPPPVSCRVAPRSKQ